MANNQNTSFTDIPSQWGETLKSNVDPSNPSSVQNQLTRGLEDQGYVVEISEEEKNAVGESWNELGDALTGANIQSSTSLADFAGVAGAVATDVAEQALQKIKEMLLAKKRVKIKSLINSVGSCVTQTPDEFVENLQKRFDELRKSLPDLITQLSLQFGWAVASDPRFQESLADLAAVQWLSGVIEKTYGLYNSVKRIVDKFEPYFPIVEIIVSAASIWATGGASAAAFSSQSAQLAAQELKKIIPLIAKPLKDNLYNTEVEVPVFILGALDFASSADSKKRFARALENAEKWAMIDDATFDEVNRGLKFPSAYNNITKQIGTSPRTSAFVRNILRKITPARYSFELFGPVNPDLTARRVSRPSAGSADDSNNFILTDADIRKLSKKIVESKDTTAAFYADRQMFKLVIEQLKEDGCSIDVKAQSYDEKKTYYEGGEGDRAAFKKINDKITDYHNLLAFITGEVRANIVEEIPVIDFYQKNMTSILSKYTDNVEFNNDMPITTASREGAGAYEITNDQILGDNPPTFNINLAVSGYQEAEFFYASKSRFVEEKNLVVEHSSTPNPTAPGILNGLFSIPKTRDQYGIITEWQWVDERDKAASYGVISLPLGTKYTPYHIWDGEASAENRVIVERPLATTTPGYPGLASEYYVQATSFIQNEIVNRFSIDPLTWKVLGGKVDAVILKKFFNPEARKIVTLKKRFSLIRKIRSFFRREDENDTITMTLQYPHKVRSSNFDPVNWTNKLSTIGGKTWLSLNTSDTTVSLRVGHTSEYEARQELNNNANTLFSVACGQYEERYPFKKTTKYIQRIYIMSPLEILASGYFPVNTTDTTLLYSSGDGSGITEDLWLISSKDLGFSLSNNGQRALCILHNDSEALAFQVTQITAFSASSFSVNNFTITDTRYGTFTYEEGVTPPQYRPVITFVGKACWVYKLAPIQVSEEKLREAFYPLRYPREFFALKGTQSFYPLRYLRKFFALKGTQFKNNNLVDLNGMTISVGLPIISPGRSYANYSKFGVSLKPMNDLLTKTAISNYIKGQLQDLPIITIATNSNKIPLSKLKDMVAAWLKSEQLLRTLAKTSVPSLSKIVAKLPTLKRIADITDAIINGNEVITEVKCSTLDSLLGNNSTPWFSIGDDPDDLISEETLTKIVITIKEALEGRPTASSNIPVKYTPGMDNPIGRPSSLYYQRYLFLNNRMNRTDGTLAKAEMLLYNWELLKKSGVFKAQQLGAYAPFIDANPVATMDPMLYLPPQEGDTSGSFYIREVIDAVRDQIHDKCLLICSPCPVRDECPFYDEGSVLRKYMPQAVYLNLWFKDNELDLLVYEKDETTGEDYLDLKSSTGRISAATMKARHKLYTEIIRDPDEELDLDTVRQEVAKRVQGFHLANDQYVDNLDWLTGGRYGSIRLATNKGIVSKDPTKHSYLYDALFIRDEETYFKYAPTPDAYDVSVSVVENNIQQTYTGKVRIKEPVELLLFEDASGESEVYLISDDTKDSNGNSIDAFIYLGLLKDLVYDFDFDRSHNTITNPDDPRKWPTAADIAQWCVNEYKWLDPTPDQYWMEKVQKLVRADRQEGSKLITLPGRPRLGDVVDPLITEEPPIEEIMRGKPMVKGYINFIRKMRIRLDSIRWTKSDRVEDIERAKRTLTYMKTNLRLVIVKK